MQCPSGLVWHEDKRRCDWKKEEPIIDCSPNKRPNCRETTRWSSNAITIAGNSAEKGSDAQHLFTPSGIFVDTKHENDVYIADSYNHRIQKFPGGSLSGIGITVAGGNGPGSAPNQLYHPSSVYVDKNENIYIADNANYRVQMWPKNAKSGITIAGGNETSGETTQMSYIFGIFLHERTNTLYVSDTSNDRVLKFVNGSKTGIIVAGHSENGPSNEYIQRPDTIFVDECETLYVADSGYSRILKYEKGVVKGVPVAGNAGSLASLASKLDRPSGFAVDQYKNVYVADTFNHRIQKWGPNDTAGKTIAGGVRSGKSSNQLFFPDSIAFDNMGNLFVCDQGNHRIQMFEILPETATC